jgi:N-acetylglucosaminyldiphosphoundecaprenol N-acetyl-beta-D-mannosaminyltransferase
MELYLKDKYNFINIVGKNSPPFRKLTDTEDRRIVQEINEAKPDILWIGLVSPKQDIWINDRKKDIYGCVIIPAGATFDFFSGRIKQAPKWIRDLGFEWLYRLIKDFRRLWIRYTVYNIIFIILFAMQRLRIVKFSAEDKK